MKDSDQKYSKFDKFLVWLAVPALVTVLFPAIPLGFLLSIIGVPIGIPLVIAPPLFCFLLTVRIFKRLPGADYGLDWALAAGLFLAIPWGLNMLIDETVSHLQSEDNLTIQVELPQSVALIQQNNWYGRNKKANCEELCLRLLLNGTVESFFANRLDQDSYEIASDSPVTRYWIEPKSSCPSMVFPDERPLQARFKNEEKGSYPADIMRQRIADGYCLLSERAIVSDAALTIFVRKLPVENIDHIRELSRISAFAPGKNHLKELYRSTQVKAERYDPILLIGKFSDNHLRSTVQLIGTHPKKTGSANLVALLAQAHVNLSIAEVEKPDPRKNLRAVLIDQTAKSDDPRFLVADVFFKQITHQHSAKPEDAELVRALLEDLRFKSMDNLKQAAPTLAWASPDGGRSLAKALSERLQKGFSDEQRFLQSTLRNMPDRAFGISSPVEK